MGTRNADEVRETERGNCHDEAQSVERVSSAHPRVAHRPCAAWTAARFREVLERMVSDLAPWAAACLDRHDEALAYEAEGIEVVVAYEARQEGALRGLVSGEVAARAHYLMAGESWEVALLGCQAVCPCACRCVCPYEMAPWDELHPWRDE